MEINFRGTLIKNSRNTDKTADVLLDHGSDRLSIRTADQFMNATAEELEILEPVGSQTGILVYQKTLQILIPDKGSFRKLRKFTKKGSFLRGFDLLENSWPIFLGGFILIVLLTIASIFWGLPATSKILAMQVPVEWVEALGQQGYEQIKAEELTPSKLSEELLETYRAGFQLILEANNLDSERYHLHFHSGSMGPNAFALPSGDIILLDELVEVGMEDNEILAVFAHEIAHVEERHGVQTLIQQAGIGIAIALFVGDSSIIGTLAVLIPKVLLENGYSRQFETEADQLAVRYLIHAQIKPQNLITALEKLHESAGPNSIPTLISSHPDLESRSESILDVINSFSESKLE